MQKVSVHIAYLLTEHPCVVIPNWGAFVTHYRQAGYNEDTEQFTQPHLSLGFNDQLRYDDGLLLNRLIEAEKMDRPTAKQAIEKFVHLCKDSLQQTGTLHLAQIGSLQLNAQGVYSFKPEANHTANAAFYGLHSFSLLPVSALENKQVRLDVESSKKDKDTLFIPISKRFLRLTASVAAIIAAVVLFSMPIDNPRGSTQQASFITGYSASITECKQAIAEQEYPALVQELPASNSLGSKAEVQTEVASFTETPAADRLDSPQKQVLRKYYIIVAGSPSKTQAEKLLAKIQAELNPEAQLVERDQMCRVSIAVFTDKPEAETFLNNFRQLHPQYHDAWLLSLR